MFRSCWWNLIKNDVRAKRAKHAVYENQRTLKAVKALEDNFIPATINYQNFDEECDLDIVANHGRKQVLNYVMSNSLGFGGHNASIIFKKYGEE